MEYSIRYVASARQDILNIASYLSQFYENTYSKFRTKLDRSVSNLANMPYMGVSHKDYRRLAVDDYHRVLPSRRGYAHRADLQGLTRCARRSQNASETLAAGRARTDAIAKIAGSVNMWKK